MTVEQSVGYSTIPKDAGLLCEVMNATTCDPLESEYDSTVVGLHLLSQDLPSETDGKIRIDCRVIDEMIVRIDKKLSDQMDAILHHERFREIEAAWRGLEMVVSQSDFSQNIRVKVLQVTRKELEDDINENPDVMLSGFYKHIYTSGYGQFGGEPVAAIIGNYYFSHSTRDVRLLRKISAVSALAHAPFIAGANCRVFGIDNVQSLADIKDIKSIFDSPSHANWNGLREQEESRYLGLTFPRVQAREPYDVERNPVRRFQYIEKIYNANRDLLWTNSAFAFATRLVDSFARYRWCPNIIGPTSGGKVGGLPTYRISGYDDIITNCPAEVLISDRREYELSEQGIIPLTVRKGTDSAVFFSANSLQRPKQYPDTAEGSRAALNHKLGTQLPYMFIITRLAHYLKVLQREQIGSWKGRLELERELGKWIKQFVSDQENPTKSVRSRRPLRKAEIRVSDVSGDPGWYRVNVDIVPHFKYMGATFTLSLKGKLDKEIG